MDDKLVLDPLMKKDGGSCEEKSISN